MAGMGAIHVYDYVCCGPATDSGDLIIVQLNWLFHCFPPGELAFPTNKRVIAVATGLGGESGPSRHGHTREPSNVGHFDNTIRVWNKKEFRNMVNLDCLFYQDTDGERGEEKCGMARMADDVESGLRQALRFGTCCSPRMTEHGHEIPRAAMNSRGDDIRELCAGEPRCSGQSSPVAGA